jgi:hypothetical protein
VRAILDENSFNLIHRNLVVPPIVQSRRPRRFVSSHLLRELAPATIAQVLSDPRGPERVIADPSLDADDSTGSPPIHRYAGPGAGPVKRWLHSAQRRAGAAESDHQILPANILASKCR